MTDDRDTKGKSTPKEQGDARQAPDAAETVQAEPVSPEDPTRFRYLTDNRALIVRRSLLATALGGALPVPILDDYFAARVRAGLFIKLAESRHVGLPTPAAEVLAEPKEGSTLRNATVTAATLIALKLAWRKFFALLAAGRGAEEAANTYQASLLFDHYCARVHTGADINRDRAAALRRTIHKTVASTSKDTLVAIFRDGGRILGRSILQAPRWASQRLVTLAERWVLTRGNPDVDIEMPGINPESQEAAWLDRATRAVEDRLSALGNDYLTILVDRFEETWTEAENRLAEAKTAQTAEKKGSEGQTGLPI